MREATDLGIGAAVRRELAGRRIDLSKIKFPVKAGVITLQGELAFVGVNKTADETAIELKFIESSLRQIAGVKELVFELDSWTQNDSGVWESSLTQPAAASSGSSSGSHAGGDGLYCDECDMVIRFCPCCGKPLAASAKTPTRQRRTAPPIKPIIKKRVPAFTPTRPAAEAPSIAPSPVPEANPAPIPTIKPVTPAAKPPVIPAVKPQAPTATPLPTPTAPAKPAEPTPVPRPVATPAPIPVVTPNAVPAAPAAPVIPAAAVPANKPVPDRIATAQEPTAGSSDDLNFDGLNLDLESHQEPTVPAPAAPKPVISTPAPAIKPAVSLKPTPVSDPEPTPAAEPVVPTPDFMKSDALTDDLFGSLIDNLSQSGNEESPEQSESERFGRDAHSGKANDEGVPDLNLASLDDFATTEPEAAAEEDISDLLPPMKPSAMAKPPVSAEPDPFADIEDTPLPPIKPAAPEPEPFEDDDTPLPPMKPKAPASKDPFAALFSESDLGLGVGGEGGKDPFASLDLDLDVLEVFPSDDQPELPPARPAAGNSQKPVPNKPAAPVDDNPFNIDNIIDLDTPVEDKPKAGKKPVKDPFDLDDFDIGKFKL